MTVSRFVLAGMSDIGLDGFVMSSVENSDLIARIVRENGWWTFERPLPALFVRCAQKWPGLFVDVGANTGFYSLLHAAVAPEGRSIAFEPFPPAAAVLRENIALNLLDDRISLRPEAVSAAEGAARLFVPPPLHGLLESRSSLERSFSDTHDADLKVEATSLDGLGDALAGLSILKIDVEGHELAVLTGGRETIGKYRPLVIMGVLGQDHLALDAIRANAGYRSVLLGGDEVITQAALAPDPRGWNHILVPEEKWGAFTSVVVSTGVRLSKS
ncbi:FkbM family methyltransferase [Brevundimonas sp.]|uniref:FkbM family methyltransferase n=1 Tax=Brevundimonas sp. TaxID=1871086 RepID=UPI001A2BA2F0|nr:FkbM family methyltransferase [Brevundimonas sp.]MBJ7485096.1 FkbM family methyltransferase [Brevundimonas sp.]